MSTSSDVRSVLEAMRPGDYLRASDIPGSTGAVATALSRELTKHPDLIRVRKGLYWKGVSSRFGAGRPSAIESALIAAGKGAGPAGWSALAALGLSTQVPSVPSIAVPGRQIAVAGLTTHKRSNLRRTDLNYAEVAILEAVRDEWFDRARKLLPARLRQLATAGLVDLERLAAVARDEPSPRVRERVHELVAAA